MVFPKLSRLLCREREVLPMLRIGAYGGTEDGGVDVNDPFGSIHIFPTPISVGRRRMNEWETQSGSYMY